MGECVRVGYGWFKDPVRCILLINLQQAGSRARNTRKSWEVWEAKNLRNVLLLQYYGHNGNAYLPCIVDIKSLLWTLLCDNISIWHLWESHNGHRTIVEWINLDCEPGFNQWTRYLELWTIAQFPHLDQNKRDVPNVCIQTTLQMCQNQQGQACWCFDWCKFEWFNWQAGQPWKIMTIRQNHGRGWLCYHQLPFPRVKVKVAGVVDWVSDGNPNFELEVELDAILAFKTGPF